VISIPVTIFNNKNIWTRVSKVTIKIFTFLVAHETCHIPDINHSIFRARHLRTESNIKSHICDAIGI
jgi:hypothetical protein